MKNSMSAWPEVIFFDGTYGLLNTQLTVYLFAVEDSNGCKEIVPVTVLKSEIRPSVSWMLNNFKKDNLEACIRILCFMCDKDLLGRDLIKEIFGVPVYICIFHTMRIFSREITEKKRKIDSEECSKVKHLLLKLINAETEDMYTIYCNKLKEIASKSVLEYFTEHWDKIKTEWTKFGMNCGNLCNTTNNRVEIINHHLGSYIKDPKSIQVFIKLYFEWSLSHSIEIMNKERLMLTTNPIHKVEDLDLQKFVHLLTDQGYKIILPQFERYDSIDLEKIGTSEGTSMFLLYSYKGQFKVTSTSCTCGFTTSSPLPCRHVFAARKELGLPLFASELCHERWTRDFYRKHQRAFKNLEILKDQSSHKVRIYRTVVCSIK